MNTNGIATRQPQVFLEENNHEYRITVVQDKVTTYKEGVYIPWGIILAVIAVIVLSCFIFSQTDIQQPTAQKTVVTTATEAPVSDEKAAFLASGFVFPDSDTRYLNTNDLESLHNIEGYSYERLLRLAVNEIYARNGYLFQQDQFYRFYSGYSWYNGHLTAEEAVRHFNAIESANRDFLVQEENRIKQQK